jgi:hypothetical protein
VVRGATLPVVVVEAVALTLGLWDAARRLLSAAQAAAVDREVTRVGGGSGVGAR